MMKITLSLNAVDRKLHKKIDWKLPWTNNCDETAVSQRLRSAVGCRLEIAVCQRLKAGKRGGSHRAALPNGKTMLFSVG